MAQAPTNRVPIASIISDPFFQMGWRTARAGGNNWDPDYDLWSSLAQWRYERGRLFAHAAPEIDELTEGRGRAKRVPKPVLEAWRQVRGRLDII